MPMPIHRMKSGTNEVTRELCVSGMFGGMAAYGYVTKRDLSGMRSILFMGLIGIIIGMVPAWE